ncbi:hypothetical protein MTO96_004602 [Rhipicephalus appendiculatus]
MSNRALSLPLACSPCKTIAVCTQDTHCPEEPGYDIYSVQGETAEEYRVTDLEPGTKYSVQMAAEKSSNDVASLEGQLLDMQKKYSNDVASLERQLLEVQEKAGKDVACLEGQLLEVQKKSSNDVASLEGPLLKVQKMSINDVASLEGQFLEVQKRSSHDVAILEQQLLKVHEKSRRDVAIIERELLEAHEKSNSDAAIIERQLLEVQKNSTSDNQSTVAAQKKAAVIQGPHRAAPRGGVFITACKFTDICKSLTCRNDDKKDLTISTDTYTLGGYTFMLQCKFTKDGNSRSAALALFLRDGEWDSYLDWPFSKKVEVSIMRPRNPAKDIRLPVNMDGHNLVKQPSADSWNYGRVMAAVNWQDIEQQ